MEENNIYTLNKDNNNLEDSQKNTMYTSEDTSIKRFNMANYTSSTEDIRKDVTSFSTSQSIQSSPKISPQNNRFPFCIVWTPIPILTYIIPSIGHTGIATSSGVIHDFAGSFFVSVDNFAFGKPTKYVQLDLSEQEKYEFDRAVEKGDNKYNMEEHNLCVNNCHSHVAYVLNQIKYKGKTNYTMVNIWWLLITKGKYISVCSFIKTYIGFLIFMFIVWIFAHKN
jgi:hypothetical protein